MKAVADRVKQVSAEDVQTLAGFAVAEIRSLFPKAKGPRNTYFAPGAHTPINRGTPLWSGWRAYPTSSNGSPGFLIKHARMGQPKIATILASLDQGSRAYTLQLDKARRFRFMSAGEIVIVAMKQRGAKGIKIPARKPQPGPDGYIKPTMQYIADEIEHLRIRAAVEMEQAFERKQNRMDLLRASWAAQSARSLIEGP